LLFKINTTDVTSKCRTAYLSETHEFTSSL